jgi:hypothetical protein
VGSEGTSSGGTATWKNGERRSPDAWASWRRARVGVRKGAGLGRRRWRFLERFHRGSDLEGVPRALPRGSRALEDKGSSASSIAGASSSASSIAGASSSASSSASSIVQTEPAVTMVTARPLLQCHQSVADEGVQCMGSVRQQRRVALRALGDVEHVGGESQLIGVDVDGEQANGSHEQRRGTRNLRGAPVVNSVHCRSCTQRHIRRERASFWLWSGCE